MSKPVSIEAYLEEHGTLTYTNVGVSMLPLLRQGRDLLTVRRKGPERCAVGDVVLYRGGPGRYVLHRVIQVRPEDYVILGDNCAAREYGITDRDIIGVMTGYVRGGREHSVEDRGYRVYTWIMLHTAGPRILVKRTRNALAGAVKRVLRRK